MILKIKDNQGKSKAKDILDMDLDMSVEQEGKAYVVRLNRQYVLKEPFESEEEAEAEMFYLADARNQLEDALWRF